MIPGSLLPSFLYINHHLFNPFFIFVLFFSWVFFFPLPQHSTLGLSILVLLHKFLFTVYHDHLELYFCRPKSLHICQLMSLSDFLLNPSS